MATRSNKKSGGPGRAELDAAQELEAAVETSELVEEAAGASKSSAPAASDRTVHELVNAFRLLSDETRLRILLYLMQNQELNVTDLCNRLGQTQPAVSHHLALLRVSGLIEARRAGKNNFYSVRTDHLNDLLAMLLSSAGGLPKKMKFHDFTLLYQGR